MVAPIADIKQHFRPPVIISTPFWLPYFALSGSDSACINRDMLPKTRTNEAPAGAPGPTNRAPRRKSRVARAPVTLDKPPARG